MGSVLILYLLSAATVILMLAGLVTDNPVLLILSCLCLIAIGLWFMLALRADEHS